jgi:hypothetical protein
MSNKDLQRVTKSLSYIGQAVSRRSLPPHCHRHHITQKVKVPMESCPNVRDMRVDSYTVVVTTAPGNSI